MIHIASGLLDVSADLKKLRHAGMRAPRAIDGELQALHASWISNLQNDDL
jgi:hypothetical protein